MPFRFLLGLALASSLVAADPQVFRVDATHSVLGFKAQTVLFDVPGRFDRYKVEISGTPANPADAKIRLVIETASVDTANPKRDDHLRSGDFFDAAKFPAITFTSSKVRREGDKVTVSGTFTMHGKSQELDIPFQAAEGVNGAGKQTWSYRATVPLDRTTFGVGTDSLAAKLSLKPQVELNLLLVGFFEAPKPAAK
jgi:polyisoprenoid-binding protein YceI